MEKSQEKITALVVALTLSGSLAGATSILLRDGEMLGGLHSARPWLIIFFVASTLVLAGMLGAAYSRQRKS